MSRSTQYIGLNNLARNYVKSALSVEKYEMTEGMFDEKIMGHIYHMPVPKWPNKEYIFKEVVQFTAWSSGPMIFTHLQCTLVKEIGQVCDMGEYFSWMKIVDEDAEYDPDMGTYCL
jgi:hypothetical protein